MYYWVHLVDAAPGICQVLIRLIGADENIYSNYGDTMQWLENTDVLEMIADKFSSSVSYKSSIAHELVYISNIYMQYLLVWHCWSQHIYSCDFFRGNSKHKFLFSVPV
jgi:hypothetical protein